MAVITANNNIVDIPVGDTIIGVLLHRFVNGDVKVRPTNVTATIDITDHDIEGGNVAADVLISAGGAADVTFNSFTEAPNSVTFGDEVIISGLIARANNLAGNIVGRRIRGRFVSSTATEIVVNLSADDFNFLSSVNVFIGASENTSIAIEDAETALEDEFILLHNGPAGGFTQQCKPGSGAAGTTTPAIPHHVNDVVQAVITNG